MRKEQSGTRHKGTGERRNKGEVEEREKDSIGKERKLVFE